MNSFGLSFLIVIHYKSGENIMKKVILSAFVAIIVALTGIAHATSPVTTYYMDEVTLSDGSVIEGHFTVDWVTKKVIDLSLTHTPGNVPSTGYLITGTLISGKTTGSDFVFSGSTNTLAAYSYPNSWTLSVNNILSYGAGRWEILYLDFNPYTGELFLDAPPVLGSRLHSYVARTAKTTWATVTGGALSIKCDCTTY